MPCDRCSKPANKVDEWHRGAYGYDRICGDCWRELGSGSHSLRNAEKRSE